jgi:hypothetical protein
VLYSVHNHRRREVRIIHVRISRKLMPSVCLEIDSDLSKSQKLWRYMNLSKFVSLIEKNALWLSRADTFRDKHEGRFPDEMKKIIEKAYEGFGEDDTSVVKDADDFQDYLLKNTFLSCWHKNDEENMVMWEIYGRDNKALAIQTTVEAMKNSVDSSDLSGHSLILKSVTYRQTDEIPGVLRYEDCFFIKRPHFSFEEEVRISLDTYSSYSPTKNNPYGHELSVSINRLIEKILIHPDSADRFTDVINSITKRYKVHAPVVRGLYGTQ